MASVPYIDPAVESFPQNQTLTPLPGTMVCLPAQPCLDVESPGQQQSPANSLSLCSHESSFSAATESANLVSHHHFVRQSDDP